MAKKVDVVRETCTRYNCCPSGKSLPQDLQRSRTKLIRSKVELIARNFQKKEIHGINVLQKNKPHNVLQLLKWFFLLEEMDIKTRRGWLSCVNRLSCLINIACLTCKPKCCFRSQSPSKGDSCLFVCLFVCELAAYAKFPAFLLLSICDSFSLFHCSNLQKSWEYDSCIYWNQRKNKPH